MARFSLLFFFFLTVRVSSPKHESAKSGPLDN